LHFLAGTVRRDCSHRVFYSEDLRGLFDQIVYNVLVASHRVFIARSLRDCSPGRSPSPPFFSTEDGQARSSPPHVSTVRRWYQRRRMRRAGVCCCCWSAVTVWLSSWTVRAS